jgi:hypothetical protein
MQTSSMRLKREITCCRCGKKVSYTEERLEKGICPNPICDLILSPKQSEQVQVLLAEAGLDGTGKKVKDPPERLVD